MQIWEEPSEFRVPAEQTPFKKWEFDRRREPRLPMDERASMHVLNPLLGGRRLIRVLDVSRGGLMLSSPVPLQLGTLIQVHLRNFIVMGEVRHCTPFGDEFRAGIQVENVFVLHSEAEPIQSWSTTFPE